MQYYCQRILKLEKRKNLQTLKIYENYYWDSLKFYLFAKKWLALKETKQLEKKESDALILEQFYQHKDFPPRPLGEKAWQPYQKLLHKWLSSILELKQENPALHTSFQTSLCAKNDKIFIREPFLPVSPTRTKSTRQTNLKAKKSIY